MLDGALGVELEHADVGLLEGRAQPALAAADAPDHLAQDHPEQQGQRPEQQHGGGDQHHPQRAQAAHQHVGEIPRIAVDARADMRDLLAVGGGTHGREPAGLVVGFHRGADGGQPVDVGVHLQPDGDGVAQIRPAAHVEVEPGHAVDVGFVHPHFEQAGAYRLHVHRVALGGDAGVARGHGHLHRLPRAVHEMRVTVDRVDLQRIDHGGLRMHPAVVRQQPGLHIGLQHQRAEHQPDQQQACRDQRGDLQGQDPILVGAANRHVIPCEVAPFRP